MKKVLTPQEIFNSLEKSKKNKRNKLEKQIIKLTKNCDKEDVIYVFSSLINNLTR